MSQEIKITDYELKECNGNLKTLSSTWMSVPEISDKTITKSKGYSADSVKSCLDVTMKMSNAMQQLLDNSVTFFESLGISFHDSDASAAQNIDSLTD